MVNHCCITMSQFVLIDIYDLSRHNLKSSETHNRRIWIDLYETTLDHEVIGALVLHVKTIEPKIYKLCFVGCSLIQTGKIRKMMKETVPNLHKNVRFYQDPEEAKKWLIGNPIEGVY